MENKDLIKLLSRLTSLKKNIPDDKSVSREYVDEFNSILIGLEKFTEENLADFVVREEKIKPRLMTIDTEGKKKYSSNEYCKRNFLLMKVDGVLSYFTLKPQPKEIHTKLGFDVEEEQKNENSSKI